MERTRPRWWLGGLMLALLGACVVRPVGGADAAAADGGESPGDSGSEAGAIGDCDGGLLCGADFPCRNPPGSICASATATQQCITESCEVMCGTPCCFGASCGGGAINPCGPGLVCFEQRRDAGAFQGPAATCLPPRDAGADASYEGWAEGTGGSYCY